MNTHCRFLAAVVLLATGLCRPGFVFAQPPPQSRDNKESLAILTKIAASLEVRLDDKRKATREDQPAMRWTNTISRANDAALFIWMHEGRPVAAGTTFITDNVAVGLELLSLAPGPLQARRGGKVIWEPRDPGIEFQRLPDAPQPGETARQRLTQIKMLARRFRAEAIKAPPAYQEHDVRQLRLHAQPILQYQDPRTPEYEGAIFAFVMDTDADVLLLIENRVRDGTAGWEYALARANPYVLNVWRDEILVWSQKHVVAASSTQPYFFAGPFPIKEE